MMLGLCKPCLIPSWELSCPKHCPVYPMLWAWLTFAFKQVIMKAYLWRFIGCGSTAEIVPKNPCHVVLNIVIPSLVKSSSLSSLCIWAAGLGQRGGDVLASCSISGHGPQASPSATQPCICILPPLPCQNMPHPWESSHLVPAGMTLPFHTQWVH